MVTKRYRCTHCQGIFTAGEVRDCCLAAAVSEQGRLRAKLVSAEASAQEAKARARDAEARIDARRNLDAARGSDGGVGDLIGEMFGGNIKR